MWRVYLYDLSEFTRLRTDETPSFLRSPETDPRPPAAFPDRVSCPDLQHLHRSRRAPSQPRSCERGRGPPGSGQAGSRHADGVPSLDPLDRDEDGVDDRPYADYRKSDISLGEIAVDRERGVAVASGENSGVELICIDGDFCDRVLRSVTIGDDNSIGRRPHGRREHRSGSARPRKRTSPWTSSYLRARVHPPPAHHLMRPTRLHYRVMKYTSCRRIRRGASLAVLEGDDLTLVTDPQLGIAFASRSRRDHRRRSRSARR